MTQKSLLERLTEYHGTSIPMHMPGHKRNRHGLSSVLPYEIDITEVRGFDNLHDMQGVLQETACLAAQLYGTIASFPLVGGSSCGVLAAMHALIPSGCHVLLARNSHRSVYHGVDLLGLTPHYLTAEADAFGIAGKILPEDVEQAFAKHPEISLVIVTSPSYEGVTQDLRSIAAICHRHEAYLLVDSAHGAHLGFSEAFPENAVQSGADVVVMSLHKTLPCLTQTALMHICTKEVEKNKIAESLSFFETSSPSYVLLASIDECVRYVSQNQALLFSRLHQNLASFYETTKALRNLTVFHRDDESKIIISTKNTSMHGTELADRLSRDFGIETEMASANFVLAMATVCDTQASLASLAKALLQIDAAASPQKNSAASLCAPVPKMQYLPAAARQKRGTFLPLAQAVGKPVLEYVWAYPPGIPLLVPGEIFSQELLQLFTTLQKSGVELKSTKGQIEQNHIYTKI